MKRLLTITLAVMLMAVGIAAGMDSIGVNLGSNEVSLTASNVAGVVAQDNWNNGSGGSGSLSNIKNEGGVATTADASWGGTSPGTWHVTGNGTATGDAKMMNGYLDAADQTRSVYVTISQIPYAMYDVYIYVGGSNAGAKGKVNDGATWYSLTNGSINPGGNGFQYVDYLLTTDTGTGYPMANYAKFAGRTSSSVTVTIGNFIDIGLPGCDEAMGIFGVQIVEVNSAVASNPSPADDAIFVSPTADLSWTAGLGAVSHDVYFGTSQAAVIAASRLAGDIDGSGSVGIGDITVLAQQWLGTPTEPYADLDDDGDVNLTDFAVVSAEWLDSANAVYKGNQSGTTYEPGTLAENTTYYWRIDEIVAGVTTTGAVWNFTTGTLQASNPSPANGATSVSVNANLSWTAGIGATSRNVYFGTSSPGAFQGNRTTTTFDPGTMALATTYYWRIDEIGSGVTTTGAVWSFTTDAESVINIMPLGDSITQGYTTYDNYRHILWNKLQTYGYSNVNFVGSHDVLAYNTYDSLTFDKDHEGHYGWHTDEIVNGGGIAAGGTGNLTIWLNGLQSAVELPDIVLMHLGSNDVLHNPFGYDQSITIGEMEDVIDVLRSYNPNVTILLAKIIPHSRGDLPSVDALNALIPGLDSYETATSEVIIVDHYTGFSTSWLADGVHPNTTGATEMSNRWYAALVPIL